jgi:hypothetical protein
MRQVVALLLVSLVVACSPAERMSYQVRSVGVAYDTVKEDKVPDTYRTQGVYDPKEAQAKPEEVKWRTLWNGLKAVEKDGYDLAVFVGPAATKLTRTITYSSTGQTSKVGEYPGFTYLVRGYKTTAAHPANAKPIATLIDEANRRAFAAAQKP